MDATSILTALVLVTEGCVFRFLDWSAGERRRNRKEAAFIRIVGMGPKIGRRQR
jgi:hypothetical protein